MMIKFDVQMMVIVKCNHESLKTELLSSISLVSSNDLHSFFNFSEGLSAYEAFVSHRITFKSRTESKNVMKIKNLEK